MIRSILSAIRTIYLSHVKQGDIKIKSTMAMVNNTLLVTGYTLFIHSILEFQVSILFILLTSVIIIYILYQWDRNKKRGMTYIIIACLLVAVAIVSYLLKYNILDKLRNWFHWLISYDFTAEYYIDVYGRVTCVFIEIILCFIFYFLHHQNKFRILTVAVLIMGCITLSLNQVLVPKVTVSITIYYAMWVISENCGYHRKKIIAEVDNYKATTFLAPVCLILALIILMVPAPLKPLSWNGVIRLVEKVQEGGAILLTKLEYFFDANGSIFSLSEAGYTEEETELGGAVSSSNKTSMIATTLNKSTASVYLAGSISDIYTGRGWSKNKDNLELSNKRYYYDFYNLVIAMAKEVEAGGDISNLIKTRNLHIKFHNIRTRSIFMPIKTYQLEIKNNTKYEETTQGSLIFKKAKSSGMEYDLNYYEMNIAHPVFMEMLTKNNAHIRPKATTMRTVLEEVFHYSNTNSQILSDEVYRDLRLLEEEIQLKYTKLPNDLPAKVKSLAEELTRDATSDYEKLKVLELYFNTFPYNTNIKKTPKGEDFVDFFLFQQKEGYCTYFASAMGVMARCLNIPTRYVEGYVLDYKEILEDDRYIIKSNKAHAWVEAYIMGVGWIPFEPTPGFYSKRYVKWKEYGTKGLNESNTPLRMPEIPDSYKSFGVMEEEASSAASEQLLGDKQFLLKVMVILLASLILSVVIFFISYVIALRRYKKIYLKVEDNEKFIMDYKKILRYLYMEGYKLSGEDTMVTFTERVGRHYNLKSLSFAELGILFIQVRYGEKVLTKEEYRSVAELKSEYEEYLKEKIGFVQMFFHEFKFLYFYQ